MAVPLTAITLLPDEHEASKQKHQLAQEVRTERKVECAYDAWFKQLGEGGGEVDGNKCNEYFRTPQRPCSCSCPRLCVVVPMCPRFLFYVFCRCLPFTYLPFRLSQIPDRSVWSV